MQCQRAAREQPGHQRQRDAGERSDRDRRQHGGVARQAAFQEGREPARDQFAMAARTRHDAVGGDVEGDDGDVGGGIARPRRWLVEIHRRGVGTVVERHHAVGQVVAEAADVADRKQLGRHLHGDLGLRIGPGTRGRDDRLGADASTARRPSPACARAEARRRDHAGAQHAEQRDDAVDGIGELDRHHGVGLQPERAQLGRQRRDGAVGLRIAETARGTPGQPLAVGRIGERQRVGMTYAGTAEQIVEGGAVAVAF